MHNIQFVNHPDILAVSRGVMSSPQENLSLFNKALKERREKYPSYKPSQRGKEVATEIEEKGYAKLEQAINHNIIDSLNDRVTEVLNDPNHEFNQAKVSESEHCNKVMYLQCYQPMLTSSLVRGLAFDDLILDIAGAYIGCKPALGTCNLRRSYVNNLNEGGTQIYHVDANSPRFLKFFLYLNDVDKEGGPFCYVEGSHKKKFFIDGHHFNVQYSWPRELIEAIYGQEKVKLLTAKKGDLLVADTNGWHRGTKPTKKNRTMLTLNYVCHHEEHNSEKDFKFPKEEFDKMSQHQKDICDLMKLV